MSRLLTTPTRLLRLEGAALLAASILLYARFGGSWWLFAALLLAPDLAMLGYLAGNRWGAAIYNLAHTSVLPLLLGGYALLAGNAVALSLALIWLAHLGLDHAFGYGLKRPSGFRHTHLNAPAKEARA